MHNINLIWEALKLPILSVSYAQPCVDSNNMEKYNIIVFVQKGGRDLPSKLIMKGITSLKELKKIMHLTMVWHNITQQADAP